MITNTPRRRFDVVEITNEMPQNRLGGVGSVVEALAAGFAAEGVDALWFVADHQYQPYEVDAILAGPAPVALGSAAELAAFDAGVAHVHSYHHGPDLPRALHGTPTLFTVHSLLACEETSNDVDLRDSVRAQERLLAACDEVVLVSEAERGHYRRLGYEALNARTAVVPNGIVPPPARPPRARRGVMGWCGRFVPRKHPEYVQMLLAEADFAGWRSLLAGKGFSLYARDLVARLGLAERARYLGWCGGPRLEAFYDAIDVLVVPSTYEPFGLAALEAAARGIPVVCTRVDGLPEVLGEHAWYADDPGYAAVRDAVRRWRDTPADAAAARCAAARERALARFTHRTMARGYGARFGALNPSWSGRAAAAEA